MVDVALRDTKLPEIRIVSEVGLELIVEKGEKCDHVSVKEESVISGR